VNSTVASMGLDHIKKSHIQTLQLPGSASWQNCALRTLRRMLAIAKEWGLLWEVPTVPLLEQRQRRDVFDQEVEIRTAAEARQPLPGCFLAVQNVFHVAFCCRLKITSYLGLIICSSTDSA
jgi:hypothetical protein